MVCGSVSPLKLSVVSGKHCRYSESYLSQIMFGLKTSCRANVSLIFGSLPRAQSGTGEAGSYQTG